mmetsp:Transcript_21747/g.45700  ORF Transcript_21747/g.45700 Transcript_21747/m.45700 type:complete len:179 (-) Transcript_21747:179-715(-)
MGYFDMTFPVADRRENYSHQRMKGASELMMAVKNNVDVFERPADINQTFSAEISNRNKYIRLCCCCFQHRSMSGNFRIDLCPSCDLRHKSTRANSTAAPADAEIRTNEATSTSRSMSISSGSSQRCHLLMVMSTVPHSDFTKLTRRTSSEANQYNTSDCVETATMIGRECKSIAGSAG